jgi:hypothetical protein
MKFHDRRIRSGETAAICLVNESNKNQKVRLSFLSVRT